MVYNKNVCTKKAKHFGGSSFIKRTTAFLMSLIMVSGVALPEVSNFFTEEVHASISSVSDVDFQRVSGFLPFDGTEPDGTNNSIADDAIYLAWSVDDTSVTGFTQELTYHTVDSMESTLKIEGPVPLSEGALQVTYTATNLNGDAFFFNPKVYSDTEGKTHITPEYDADSNVYSAFIIRPYTKLISITPEPTAVADPDDPATSADYGEISFYIEPGYTFSFEYGNDGKQVTFRLDNNGYFHYYTDQLSRSNNRIYDFHLTHKTNEDSAEIYNSYINVHLGMDDTLEIKDPTSTITSLAVPFDEGMGAFVDESLKITETGIWSDRITGDGKPDNTYSPLAPFLQTYVDPYPGNKVGIYVNVPIPKAWDKDSNSFTVNGFQTHKGEDNTATVDQAKLTVMLSNEANITISQFGSGYEVLSGGTSQTGGDTKTTLLSDQVEGFVSFKISGLVASTLYDGTRLNFTYGTTQRTSLTNGDGFHSTSDITCKSTTFYTFLAYEIQNFGPDQFMAAITTYSYANATTSLSGYYRLYFYGDDVVVANRGELEVLLQTPIPSNNYFSTVTGTSGDTLLVSLGNILNLDHENPNSLPSIRIGFSETMFTSSPGANDTEIYSQILNYEASAENLNLGVPIDLTVTNSQVVYGSGDTDAKLLLDLQWEIVNPTVLDYLFSDNGVSEIIFPLSYRSTPDQENGDKFIYISLTDITGFPDNNSQEGTVTLNTTLQNAIDPPWNPSLTNAEYMITFLEGSYSDAIVKISLEIPVTDANLSSIYDTFFKYPGTYFLTVENEYWINGSYVDGLGESTKETLTLNGIESDELPAPGNIAAYVTADELGELLQNSITVEWNKIISSDLTNYISSMLYPRNVGINGVDSLTYNLYISHSIEGISKYAELRNSESNTPEADENTAILDFEALENALFYSELNSSNWSSTGYTAEMATLVKNLRNTFVYENDTFDSILVLQGLTNTDVSQIQVLLNSLDSNQVYYFSVDTQVQAFKLATDEVTGLRVTDDFGNYILTDEFEDFSETFRVLPRRSKLSSIVTATTIPDYDEPNPDDISPEAPTGLDKKDVSLNQATVYWDRFTNITEAEQATLGFEILRLENLELSDALAYDTTLDFKTVWKELDQESSSPAAYDIFNVTVTGDITAYSVLSGDFSLDVPPSDITYEYQLTEQSHELIDYTLSPNRLYFYYVRTVKYVDEGNGLGKSAYSIWMPVSVTTDPVQGPINLFEERDKSPDRETKIAISFDAPIDLRTSGVSDDYVLQYSIKLDGEDWQDPVIMANEDLIITTIENPDTYLEGYTHYDYLIEGLLPGTSYSIKVRLWDTSLDDFSIYSNIIYTRTDIDQDDLNNYEDTTEWLDILQGMLEDLKKTPYWILNNSDGNLEAIYRDDMFNAVIDTSTTSSLALGTSSGNSQQFYISATSLLAAQQADKNFSIINGNLEVLFPSISFDSTIVDGLITASEELKNKNIADYYLKLSVVATDVEGEIDGKPNVSPKYTVTMEVIATSIVSASVDANIEDRFLQEIVNVLAEDAIYTELSNKVSAGSPSEEVIQYLNEVVRIVWTNFTSQTQEVFSQSATAVYPITSITSIAGNVNPIKLSYNGGTTSSITGYYLTGNTWNAKDTKNVNGVFSFTTTTPGIFIFAGSVIEIPNIGTIPGAENITAIVAKYALDDLFGKGENFDLKADATTYMILGSLARIGGASKDMSVSQWYQSKGVTVSTRTIDQPISNQNAIYYLMLLYEDKTNSNVTAVKINNMAATSNMLGLTDNVKPYMAAAVQMGLVTDKNLNAGKTMTIEEFLLILENFSTKVNL